VKNPSYLAKFNHLKAASGAAGEGPFLQFFESLNEYEWQALMEDLISEAPNAFKVFSPPRGEELICYGSVFFEQLGLPTQRVISGALERLIENALSHQNLQLIHGALFISAILPGTVVVPFLLGLAGQSSLSDDIREEVIDTLANHANEVPVSYWKTIDLNRYPNLAPATISALAEHSPVLALNKLITIELPPTDQASLEYPVRITLRKLIALPDWPDSLLSVYESSREWVMALLNTVLDFSEFESLRLPFTSPAVALVRQLSAGQPPDAEAHEEHLSLTQIPFNPNQYQPPKEFYRRLIPDYISYYLEDERLKPLSDRSEEEMTYFFSANLARLNGSDRGIVGRQLGATSAKLEINGRLNGQGLGRLWRSLLEAVKSDNASLLQNLPLHFIKAYAEGWASESWRMPEGELWETIYNLRDLRSIARSVKTAASKHGITVLKVAVSEFHEDRILSALLKHLLREVDMDCVRACYRKWGSLETDKYGEADLGLMSDANMPKKKKEKLQDIYKFRGYYAFARRDWLERLAEEESNSSLPQKVADTINELLSGAGTANGDYHRNVNISTEACAWLALSGDVWIGFPEIKEAMEVSAKRINGAELLPYRDTPLSSFKSELERFFRGEVNVFIGGAVHGRLLQQWCTAPMSDHSIELLGPKQFNELMGSSWPPDNRLDFGVQLAKPNYHDLRDALTKLYLGLGRLLNIVANSANQNEDVAKIVNHLMSILLTHDGRHHESKWSFVTHKRDMIRLLSEDNEYRVSA
jgi:hypothetical protein